MSLYLRVPPGVEVGDGEDARRRREWLDSVGALLQRVVGAEARMWLISALSSLEVPSHVQVDCFFDLLHNSMRENTKRSGESGYGKWLRFDNIVRKLIQILRRVCFFNFSLKYN